MPEIIGYLDPARDAPGVVIPLFREIAQSNIDLIEVIDPSGAIVGFREIAPPTAMFVSDTAQRAAEVGDPAIWAFKDHLGEARYGCRHEWGEIAHELLRESELFRWPLARLELGSLTDPEKPMQTATIGLSEYHRGRWRSRSRRLARCRDLRSGGSPGHSRALTYHVGAKTFRHTSRRKSGSLCWGQGARPHQGDRVVKDFNGPGSHVDSRAGGSSAIRREVSAPSGASLGSCWRGRCCAICPEGPAFRGRTAPFCDCTPRKWHDGCGASPAGQRFPDVRRLAEQARTPQTHGWAGRAFCAGLYIRHLINVRPFSFGSPPAKRLPVSELRSCSGLRSRLVDCRTSSTKDWCLSATTQRHERGL